MTVVFAHIQDTQLTSQDHLAAVESANTGASVLFIGRVRNHDPQAHAEVVALEYTHHPSAEIRLAEIAALACGETGVRVALSHRTGIVNVGEAAVVIAVASAHREEAFRVCRQIIEKIKTELPIWKKQIESDGSSTWLGLGD